MDIFAIFFLVCVSVLFGIISTLCIQYYILYVYLKASPEAKPFEKRNSIDYSLPESLRKQLEIKDEENGSENCSLPISLVLQFLFHELRHSEYIKRWLYKKLSLEFDELLTKTTIGKFFESINIRDMHLGNEFPDIKDIRLDNVKLDKKEGGHVDTVSLCLNLDYTGSFMLSIDAKMKFGKTAYLSITVKKICGLARLQFSREPYTHWSFSFFNDPVLDLAVESHFQGRQLQSNITNLIVNQIKKAIKRKHTLPNYKIRYKPFFVKTDPSQLDTEDSEIVPQGQLGVTCVEISRLSLPNGIHNIYCTFALDNIPWISLYQKDDSLYMILEITMSKLRQAQLGVIFKQEQGGVSVESVASNSCAYRSGLRAGDIVISVENKVVATVPQVAKFIKSISAASVTLRVERIADNYLLRNKYNDETDFKVSNVSVENEELTQMEQDTFVIVDKKESDAKKSKCLGGNSEKLKSSDRVPKIIPTNENMSKLAQTIGNFSLRKRKTSVTDRPSSETGGGSSTKNIPNLSTLNAVLKQQQHQSISVLPANSLTAKKHSVCELPEIIKTDLEGVHTEILSVVEVYKGKELTASSILQFNDDYQFNLKDGSKYLNINVWGTIPDDDKEILLGYSNIPLSHILNECCNSVLGHYIRCYSFLPPTNIIPNNQTHPLLSHSGFEHVFCYGDILLSFIWNHVDDIELKRKMSSVNLETDIKQTDINNQTSKHDFVRTQFHRTTHCDFCSKKIWLKDAVQCRQCGMCCHKKCIVKCQISTGCNPNETSTLRSDSSEGILQPDITMTEPCDDIVENGQGDIKTCNNLKRVNSVNNLAIPGAQTVSSTSRSLPPSPQRTPSRKQSIVSVNPFVMCPEVLEEIKKNPDEAGECVNKLLDQVMLCPPDENLMDSAKETGRQMYSNMPHEVRVEKINLMMAELKKTLDAVTMEHMELTKKMAAEEIEVEKAKIAFLMGQADAKVHGLSVLMLHYCSSLQQSQEKIV